jgi:alpha-L-arabinofuranosidase
MYSENRVDSILSFTTTSPEMRPSKSGSIGVSTNDTQAEFKDILVKSDGSVIFDANTATEKDWQYGKSGKKGWSWNNTTLAQTELKNQTILTKMIFDGNYTINLKARKLSGKNGFIVNLLGNVIWQIGGDNNKANKIMGLNIIPSKIVNFVVEDNRWYDLKVEVKGDFISCFLDGVMLNQANYPPIKSLYVSIGINKKTNELIMKVVNLSPQIQKTQIKLPGMTFNNKAVATVLTSDNPTDRNSLEEPNKVVPKEIIVNGVSSDFEYAFPANSATVLRLKRK